VKAFWGATGSLFRGIRLAPNKAQWWGIKRGQITYANWLRISRIVHSVVRNKMLTKIQEKMLGEDWLKAWEI